MPNNLERYEGLYTPAEVAERMMTVAAEARQHAEDLSAKLGEAWSEAVKMQAERDLWRVRHGGAVMAMWVMGALFLVMCCWNVWLVMGR